MATSDPYKIGTKVRIHVYVGTCSGSGELARFADRNHETWV